MRVKKRKKRGRKRRGERKRGRGRGVEEREDRTEDEGRSRETRMWKKNLTRDTWEQGLGHRGNVEAEPTKIPGI